LETEPEEERSDDIIIVNYAKLQSEKRMKYKGERKKKNPKGGYTTIRKSNKNSPVMDNTSEQPQKS